MRRRDFAIGLAIASAVRRLQAQKPARQHRIAVVIPSGPAASIGDLEVRAWQAFFGELRRLGDNEGQNLTIGRFSGEGRPEGYAELAREVVSRKPEVIVAVTNAIAQATRAATGTVPIVWIGGDPISAGLATRLARPGDNITGVTVYVGPEIWGKRLQILKEVVPSATNAAFLTTRTSSADDEQQLREAGRQLQISVIGMALEEATPSEIQSALADITRNRPDGIIVSSIGDLFAHRRLIVELVEKSRLPAIYPWREYIEAGGLMAYASDDRDLWRRIADDVHQILNGANPGDIPIYQPTKFELLINLKAARELGLTIPPTLLGTANEVIE